MANYINGFNQASIDWNGGVSQASAHTTRAEKIKAIEKNVSRAYERIYGEPLPDITKGIVVAQLGKFPHDEEIIINPGPQSICGNMAVDVPSPLRIPYVYVSKSYLFDGGKLVPLIDDETVLVAEEAQKAAERMADFFGLDELEYQGVKLIKFTHRENPYRVWTAKMAGEMKVICMSLLNGVTFVVAPKDMPAEITTPEKQFMIGGEIRFYPTAKEGCYDRY